LAAASKNEFAPYYTSDVPIPSKNAQQKQRKMGSIQQQHNEPEPESLANEEQRVRLSFICLDFLFVGLNLFAFFVRTDQVW